MKVPSLNVPRGSLSALGMQESEDDFQIDENSVYNVEYIVMFSTLWFLILEKSVSFLIG